MKKVLMVLAVVAIAFVAWSWLGSSTVTYVATVESEVAALEAELFALEAAVTNGTLTPEAAAEAQARIVARIDAISIATEGSQQARLTDEQRAQLVEGLHRLTQILTTYQATLVSVDAAVATLPQAERPRLNPRGSTGGGRNSVAAIAAETIVAVEEQVVEIVATIEDEATVAEIEAELSDNDGNETSEADVVLEADIAGDVIEETESASEEVSEVEVSPVADVVIETPGAEPLDAAVETETAVDTSFTFPSGEETGTQDEEVVQ